MIFFLSKKVIVEYPAVDETVSVAVDEEIKRKIAYISLEV